MRIYVVNFNGVETLVEANAPSQAVMHVASGVIAARPAKPGDVARLMAAGAKVETVAKEVV
jgi:hypothetical protein